MVVAANPGKPAAGAVRGAALWRHNDVVNSFRGQRGRSGSPRRLLYSGGWSIEGGSPVRGRRSSGGRHLSGQGGAVHRCEAHRCRVGPGQCMERAIPDGAPMVGKVDGIGRVQTLLMAQRLYPQVQLHSMESLGRTKAAWRLKAAAHQGQRRRSSAECGSRLSTSKAEKMME
jgi:hypothetical protein